MPDSPVVRLEKDGEIGVIIVNYPPVNALGPGVAEGIIESVNKANGDPSIKAMVLMGNAPMARQAGVPSSASFVYGREIPDTAVTGKLPITVTAQDVVGHSTTTVNDSVLRVALQAIFPVVKLPP